MRWLLLLFCMTSYSWGVTTIMLGAGGVTPHITNSKKYYCNQWNDTGIIFNRIYYARLGINDHSVTVMQGEDSICSSITGFFYGYTFARYEYHEFGLVAGGYSFKQENWDANAVNTPPGFDRVDLVSVDILGLEFVPILGIEWSVHLIRGKSWSLKLNNILTPIITNHSLALELRF